MAYNLPQEAEKLRGEHSRRKSWKKIVVALACVVVFCTTYALILPAITMEKYKILDCPFQAHQHTENCYDENHELICGQADYAVHVHNKDCFDKNEKLLCQLPEIERHIHDESCYEDQRLLICGLEENGHVHGESCYTRERSDLLCTSTDEGHQHTDACYAWNEILACSQEESDHQHSESCYKTQRVLSCGKLELHTHAKDCRDENGNLICGETELLEHVHDRGCFRSTLTEEEQAQVNAVIALIDALPSKDEITEQFTALENDEDAYNVYYMALQRQAVAAYDAYAALTELQQAEVRNADKLMELEWLWSVALADGGEKGYVKQINISMVDGSAPFDSSDTAGNDSSANNQIVRSFDMVEYSLVVNFDARDQIATAEEALLHFEMTMEADITDAQFDPSKMLWLGETYEIECLDAAGKTVLYGGPDGSYYTGKGANGAYTGKVNLNKYVSDSLQGNNSYQTTIVTQKLTGTYTLEATNENPNVLSSMKTFSAGIQVGNANNGAKITPHFKLWLDGNEKNLGRENTVIAENQVNAPSVTVSAGANFNVQIKKGADMSYKSWFDFSTGKGVDAQTQSELDALAILEANKGKANPAEFVDAEGQELTPEKKAEYASYRYGRITGYGVTLQLHNGTTGAAKGMKGYSLPVGEITFDLNFTSSAKSGGKEFDRTNYTPILWDYNENVDAANSHSYTYADRGKFTTPNDGLGNWGRTLYWNNEPRSTYAKGAGPGNYRAYSNGCYYGGDWEITSEKSNPFTVTGTGAGTTYRFKVSDYDFDFDAWTFPTEEAGNAGVVSAYDTYAKCFSASYVQVLNVFPRYQLQPVVDLEVSATVNNLSLSTRDNQKLAALSDDATKYGHEMYTGDNTRRDKIDLYAIGGPSKGNSFNGRSAVSEGDQYLGTAYWGTAYDCSTFAGDEISLLGYGLLSAATDYRIKSMNLLQLFDSRALSIDGDPSRSWRKGEGPSSSEAGTERFLYAADPDYPGGYDTNAEGVLQYMNTVREEDLLYYSSLDDLKKDGYTCVGVLMEVRGCDLMGGKYQFIKIPIKVTDDPDLVGKTVATINTFRVWTDANDLKKNDGSYCSWADGVWNPTTGKNTLDGYSEPSGFDNITGRYSAEIANGKGNQAKYVKTEYENGQQKAGTHAGGVQSGNSLLILGYRAGVDIKVDKTTTTGKNPSYDLDNGERTVNYTLTDIETIISDLSKKELKTSLSIPVRLDSGTVNHGDGIQLNLNTYSMTGYEVDEEGNPVGAEKAISIGTNPSQPTKIGFYADGKFYWIEIYAVPDAGRRNITFELKNVPVGLPIPDIRFSASLGKLNNNDTIDATAAITGEGDRRAYSEAAGNMDTVTIGIIQNSGAALSKAVDQTLTELDGTINYTVSYTNKSNIEQKNIYFYDMLPYNDDGRGTKLNGTIGLDSFSAELSGEPLESYNAIAYYSTDSSPEFRSVVEGFNGTTDASVSANKTGVETTLKAYFKQFAHTADGNWVIDVEPDTIQDVTCVFVEVHNLGAGQTVSLKLGLSPDGNQAANIYSNTAYSWLEDTSAAPLVSNLVQTVVVEREISGLVWYDANYNGIQDDGEPLLSDVTCTLYRKGLDGSYAKCTKDVTGAAISPVTTGEDGAYFFGKLPEGEYIVAFDGTCLDHYRTATQYQVNGKNDLVTSDGAELPTDHAYPGVEGKYVIRYDNKDYNIILHTKDTIASHLDGTSYKESYTHQDLGMMNASYELPETGSYGTIPYTIAGTILLALSAGCLLCRNKRKRGKGGIS